jgi:hypothetical protein
MNYDTFMALTKISPQELKFIKTRVNGANGARIPFIGEATIKLYLDTEQTIPFEQTFHIASQANSCEANILGMTWIPKGNRHPIRSPKQAAVDWQQSGDT